MREWLVCSQQKLSVEEVEAQAGWLPIIFWPKFLSENYIIM
jgi:hypothetical protein